MSKISLKHSGGNVVSLNSPTNAPSAADVAFKLPNADGTSGQVLKTDGSGNLSFGADSGGKFASYAIIGDQKSDGTSGGSFTQAGWRTRDLNAEIADPDGIVSISSNQFTLQAGTYLVNASAPARKVTTNQTALYNVTDSSYTQYGTVEIAHISYIGGSRSVLSARFTISSAKAFEIRHFSSHTQATTGFGPSFSSSDATTAGGVAIFTIVEIFKEA